MALLESQHGPSSTPPDGNPSVVGPPRFRTPAGTQAPPLSRVADASVDAAFEDDLDEADAFDGDPDAPVATFVMERGEMERRVSALDFANPGAAGYHVHDGAQVGVPAQVNIGSVNGNAHGDARTGVASAQIERPVTPGYQVLPIAPAAPAAPLEHAPVGASRRPLAGAMSPSVPAHMEGRAPRARTGTLLAAQGATVAPVAALPPPIPAPRTNQTHPPLPAQRVTAGTALPMPLAPAPLTPAPPSDVRTAPTPASSVDQLAPLFGSALAPARAGLPAPGGPAGYGRATTHGAVPGPTDARAWGAPNVPAVTPVAGASVSAPPVATVTVAPARGAGTTGPAAPAATALGWQGQTAMGWPSHQPASLPGDNIAMGLVPAASVSVGEPLIAMGQPEIEPQALPAAKRAQPRRGATLVVRYWYPLFILLVAGFFAVGYAYFAAQDAKRSRPTAAANRALQAATPGTAALAEERNAPSSRGEDTLAPQVGAVGGPGPAPAPSEVQPAPAAPTVPSGTPAASVPSVGGTATANAANEVEVVAAQGPAASGGAPVPSIASADAAAKVAPIVAQPTATPPHGTTEVPRTGTQVVFESQPTGAYVTLIANGQSQGIGKTPVASYVDPNGKYEVVFALDGHRTKVASLNPKRSKAVSVRLSAQRDDAVAAPAASSRSVARAKTGTLMINAKPPCEIYVDGRATGLFTPQRDVVVTAGTHTITLVNKQSGIRKQIAVSVAEGKNTKIVQDYTGLGK